jgi:NhaP-type Na+/H+ and K+/H+ antiporter
MSGVTSFGLAVLLASLAVTAAVLSSRASQRLRIPALAFFLVAAAAASYIWQWLGKLSYSAVQQSVTVALAVILFDGWHAHGMAAIPVGSGFLAVFIAGILLGDEHAPYKGEIAHSTPPWRAWPRSWPSCCWA